MPPETQAPLLRVSALTKRFGGFTALDNVSVEIRPGERFGLIGPNGSGKTTLINCISGAFRTEPGTVTFRDEDITRLQPHMRTRRGIARSFQIPRPFKSMTVSENLMVALDFAAVTDEAASAPQRRDTMMSILTRMGLASKADVSATKLSQVELRKMELARAMATHPKLLISDEAMAGLSSSEVDEVLDLLMSLASQDITIIMIEHIMQAVMRPKSWLTSACRMPTLALSLAINDLDAGYGAVKALRGVTLHVEAGETVALLGTNGNGKSTLMKCVAGLVRPQRGSMSLTIDGMTHDLARLSTEAIVDLGVALVPEGRRLFPKLTVLENLMLGAFRKAARRNIDRNLALAFETFPALKGLQSQLAGTMSGGQQQMLAIARALMSSPRLLLIDEPSVGLSPLLVSQTIAKIGELNQHLGLTVLMAEQNFNQAIRIADRGYIIVHGEIVVAADSVDELRGNDIVKRLYLGGIA